MIYSTPTVLTSYSGSSGGAASSILRFLLMIIVGIAVYFLWSKGVIRPKTKIKNTLKPLILGIIVMVFSILGGIAVGIMIAFPLCFIGIYLTIKSAIDRKHGKSPTNYYPSYWVAFSVVYTIFTTAAFILPLILFPDHIEFIHAVLIYIFGLFVIIPLVSVYFLPYLIANKHDHRQKRAIYILNIFAGWTIIAWIIALIWAHTVQTGIHVYNAHNLSNADELRKYKELLDNGIISKEEFEAKKEQLLDL